MANATLVITATITNGGGTFDAELEQCKRVSDLALQIARRSGSTVTSGTVTDGGASASYVYTAVATK